MTFYLLFYPFVFVFILKINEQKSDFYLKKLTHFLFVYQILEICEIYLYSMHQNPDLNIPWCIILRCMARVFVLTDYLYSTVSYKAVISLMIPLLKPTTCGSK